MNGLTYIPDFITPDQHDELIRRIDLMPWNTELKRRTQHYGYKYDYTQRIVNSEMKVDPLPDWTQFLQDKLGFNPDQLIINEYEPGQGIANHIDCIPCFNNVIASISLNSHCVMRFINKYTKEKSELLLEPKSALILQDEARYDYTHGIPARLSDKSAGEVYTRSRRISLTFRRVILS